MAKCKRCGKHGLFLGTDAFGLCVDCVQASLGEELNKSQKGTAEVQHEYEQILRQYNELNAMVTPEMLDVDALSKRIEQLRAQQKEVTEAVDAANGQLKALQDQILVAEDVIELESYALYRPTYNFTTSEEYKNRLDEVRQKQKEMIRDKMQRNAVRKFEY